MEYIVFGSNFALLVKSPGDDAQLLLTTVSRYVYIVGVNRPEDAFLNDRKYFHGTVEISSEKQVTYGILGWTIAV